MRSVLCTFLAAVVTVSATESGAFERIEAEWLGGVYGSPSLEDDQSDSFSHLLTNVRWQGAVVNSEAVVDGTLIFAVGESTLPYIDLPKSYLEWTLSPHLESEISVGRRPVVWSRMDQHWSLGLWNPQLRYDFLEPREQSLTGVLFETRPGSVEISLFGSFLFVPDMGPQFDLRQGRFESRSRWFQAPTSQLIAFEQEKNLRYDIEMPSVRDVVLHPTLAGRIRISPTPWGWVQVAYAHKPINQIYLQFNAADPIAQLNGDGVMSTAAATTSTVGIAPKIVSHHLLTVETGMANVEGFEAWVSFNREMPHKPALPTDWMETEMERSDIVSAWASRSGELGGRWLYTVFGSFFKQWSRDENRGTSLISSDSSKISFYRFPFSEALRFGGQVEAGLRGGQRLALGMEWTASVAERGSMLSSFARWRGSRVWSASLGWDLIGSEDPDSESFFNRFRANDRVTASVAYAF